MDKIFVLMFCYILDLNGIYVIVIRVLGWIFLLIVGEELGKDLDGFGLLMF